MLGLLVQGVNFLPVRGAQPFQQSRIHLLPTDPGAQVFKGHAQFRAMAETGFPLSLTRRTASARNSAGYGGLVLGM